jgi:hypothetical protein
MLPPDMSIRNLTIALLCAGAVVLWLWWAALMAWPGSFGPMVY